MLSKGIQYVISTDTSLTFQQTQAVYQKRWGRLADAIEEYHKALKNNASIQQSPAKTIQPQANPIFASLCAYCKLERLKVVEKTNQFALKVKARLYLKAPQAAFFELNALKAKLASSNWRAYPFHFGPLLRLQPKKRFTSTCETDNTLATF